MRKGVSKNTLKVYDSAWYFFSSFCLSFSVNPIPVNIPIICAFIVHSSESRKLKPSSIKAMVSGIQFHLRCLDPSSLSILSHPSIRLLLNGLKKDQPQGKDKRLPLSIDLVHKLVGRLRQGCFSFYEDKMLEAIILTAFFGFLRVGEFTTRSLSFNPQHDLTFSDLSFEPNLFTLFLKESKADKFKRGVPVVISRTNSVFCPFSSMSIYLQCRARSLPQDPLFIIPGGNPMSRPWFAEKLKLLCLYCGLSPEFYTPHSLRIGAATTAALKVPVATLKILGRWSSAAYERYVRLNRAEILLAQNLMSSSV